MVHHLPLLPVLCNVLVPGQLRLHLVLSLAHRAAISVPRSPSNAVCFSVCVSSPVSIVVDFRQTGDIMGCQGSPAVATFARLPLAVVAQRGVGAPEVPGDLGTGTAGRLSQRLSVLSVHKPLNVCMGRHQMAGLLFRVRVS